MQVTLVSTSIKNFNKYKGVIPSFFRNNSGVFNGKIDRKFLIALGSHYKKRFSPLSDVTTMKKFSELEFHGEYKEFSLLSIAAECQRH